MSISLIHVLVDVLCMSYACTCTLLHKKSLAPLLQTFYKTEILIIMFAEKPLSNLQQRIQFSINERRQRLDTLLMTQQADMSKAKILYYFLG